MLNLVYFLSTPRGRFFRIVFGLVLLWFGAYVFEQPWVMAIALIPILTGAVNLCLFAPLIQEPMRGSELS